ncbi:MAG: maltose alpha-D-glucosyltransferase [Rhodopirellula sp.]|nr:maltose alpha-D-glucosyltransferase [Rhodopirellula sp.]
MPHTATGGQKLGAAKVANPFWYKDAVIYQLHVRSFFDSNDDGIGDLPGLTQKLDYLQDLGVTAVWLLPFYPSPLKDDGYDIADYRNIHPHYGSLRDFKTFLREAHRRGLRVITELVINHTSDQHPWFRRARRSKPGSRWRDFYVWSDSPDRYREARIIFKDFEASNWSWDHAAHAYYWHRFYHHQPDLNFANPDVQRAVFQTLDHWLGMGVDGLRLDAVPYLYEEEGTNCENLPETHTFLKKLRAYVDSRYQERMLLAEANQWPEDAAAYFGDGDECHSAFHFPLMPRMYMAVHMEDRFPVVDILQQTPQIPDNSQWMLFLRNHDELTLEMVTEEERSYMYRVYARDPQSRINVGIRRRLAPLMSNNRRRIELLNGLLLSLPGTPVIYYGDEIGMGDNIYLGDRNGVRTPMQWSADRNAGFSRANPQQLFLPPIIDYEYHYEAINVQTQRDNPHSLLAWMKRLINLRQQSPPLMRGTLEFLFPENSKVLAYLRRSGEETALVVANLSRFAQFVELDLSQFEGATPVELFGRVQFPRIGELPYLLTLTPHAFFWFSIQRPVETAEASGEPTGVAGETPTPLLEVAGDWDRVFEGRNRRSLEQILPAFLNGCRWFGGKANTIRSARIVEAVSMQHVAEHPDVYLTAVHVEYADADAEDYLLPLGFGDEEQLQLTDVRSASPIVARLQVDRRGMRETGALYDAFGDEAFSRALLEVIASRRVLQGWGGKLSGRQSRAFRRLQGPVSDRLEVIPLRAEQSDSEVLYGNRFILKLFRRLEEGINPDLEIGAYLTDQVAFAHIPPVAGAIEYRADRSQPATMAVLRGFVANEGNAWQFTLDSLSGYFERVFADATVAPPETELPRLPLLTLSEGETPDAAKRWFGSYLESAELLGRRTAELHTALASETENPSFSPERFSRLYQRSLYQGLRNQAARSLQLLQRCLDLLPVETRASAEDLLGRRPEVEERLQAITRRGISAVRMRNHGNYHLGQVLYTGSDFIIIDFEGEPARPISERQIKMSPLRDVAGMLRSFDYACHSALDDQFANVVVPTEDYSLLDHWVRFWVTWTSAAFLRSYLAVSGEAPFVPKPHDAVQTLLDAYLLEKAFHELQYELNNRPDWAHIPLRGILRLLETTN